MGERQRLRQQRKSRVCLLQGKSARAPNPHAQEIGQEWQEAGMVEYRPAGQNKGEKANEQAREAETGTLG